MPAPLGRGLRLRVLQVLLRLHCSVWALPVAASLVVVPAAQILCLHQMVVLVFLVEQHEWVLVVPRVHALRYWNHIVR